MANKEILTREYMLERLEHALKLHDALTQEFARKHKEEKSQYIQDNPDPVSSEEVYDKTGIMFMAGGESCAKLFRDLLEHFSKKPLYHQN